MGDNIIIQRISFHLQVGLVSEKLSMEVADVSLINIKRHVCNCEWSREVLTNQLSEYLLLDINERFSGHGQNQLLDKLILFKHDYSLPNMLQVKRHMKFLNRTFLLPKSSWPLAPTSTKAALWRPWSPSSLQRRGQRSGLTASPCTATSRRPSVTTAE